MSTLVGKRIRIVNPIMTFGDYDEGDTAVIFEDNSKYCAPGVSVRWDVQRFSDPFRESNRCAFVRSEEYELVEET